MSFDLRKQSKAIFPQGSESLLGELLLKAGIITQHQLDEALKLAGNKHMQLGQMLLMTRAIKQQELQSALDAQSALRNHMLDQNAALRALTFAFRNNMPFSDALNKMSRNTSIVPSHRLGQLLLEANLISSEQLSVAVQKSMAIGLPVGRILILNNVITDAILSVALEVLIKMRDGSIGYEEGATYLADMLRESPDTHLGIDSLEEASLFNKQIVHSTRKSMHLGELFVLANILSETDVMNALEFSLVTDRPLGEAFLEHGFITVEIMDAAMKLQSLVESDTLDNQRAAQCLNLIHVNSMSLTAALEAVNSALPDGTQLDFITLLTDSRVVNNDDIDGAIQLTLNNPRILAQILSQTGYLTNEQANILVECHEAITHNIISHHDAKFVLDFCLQKLSEGPITFLEGLEELGWSKDEIEIQQKAAEEKDSRIIKAKEAHSGTEIVPEDVPKMNGYDTQPPQSVLANAVSQNLHLGSKSPNVADNKTASGILSGKINRSLTPQLDSEKARGEPGRIEREHKEYHTGKTTSNMPAIPAPTGLELHPMLSQARKQPMNLKRLLQEEQTGESAIFENTESENLQGQTEKIDRNSVESGYVTATPQEILAAMQTAIEKEASESADENQEKTVGT